MANIDNAMVLGQSLLSIVEAMGSFKDKGLKILEESGISNPQPDKWYPLANNLEAFKRIESSIGPKTLFQIGKKVPENSLWPPEIDNMDKAFGSIDIAYHMNHKGGDIGTYKVQKVGDKELKVITDNPYPCDFDLGLLEAIARKFKPDSSMYASVKHENEHVCRKDSSGSCTYVIKW